MGKKTQHLREVGGCSENHWKIPDPIMIVVPCIIIADTYITKCTNRGLLCHGYLIILIIQWVSI